MVDVLIQQCTLRVVRRGGWNWGPDPARLLQSVVRALPELISRRLDELVPDDDDYAISTPLRLNVSLRLTDALALNAEAQGITSPRIESTLAALNARLEQTFREIFPNEQERANSAETIDKRETIDRIAEETFPREPAPRRSLLRLLMRWSKRGELLMRLASFPVITLESWHDALLSMSEETSLKGDMVSPETIRQLMFTMARADAHQTSDRATLLRERIALVVAVAEMLEVSPGNRHLRRELDRTLTLADAPQEVADGASWERAQTPRELLTGETPVDGPTLAPLAKVTQALKRKASTPGASLKSEVYVSSALPFLLLGPLAQVGYLETLAATLEAARLSHDIHFFAAALAYKVLPPPERGWRRKPSAAITAAAFAGLDDTVSEQDLTEFARQVRGHLAPLDLVLSYALIRGHSPGQPLLLYRTGAAGGPRGLLLVDVEGLFPIAWACEWQELLQTLRQFGQTALLIPGDTAEPDLLKELDKAGFYFITDAQPSRGEKWRPVRRAPPMRWHTNDVTTSERNLLEAARPLASANEELKLLWQSLVIERPSIPLAADEKLEKSLTLAASVALGTISWTLWRARETSVPLLALERFGDLGAHVCFDERSVRVRLPLGRRYRDLYEHRLLEDIADVPWLDGRTIQFAGG